MAPSFGRSISFPISPARKPARHVRSISLPCRSHPLLAHLHAHIAAVRSWAAAPSTAAEGLALVGALHAALADLLLLPEPQAALTGASDRVLDAFLVLADAIRGFQETLLALKADVADVQAALRRSDAARLASAARSQRRNEKELARLAATVSSSSFKCARPSLTVDDSTQQTAVALMDAAAASAAASAAVFSTVASMSASSSSSSKKTATTTFAAFTKKNAAAAPETVKLEELAQCIHDCETGSETVFRSIVRTRVSLLNIRTPAI